MDDITISRRSLLSGGTVVALGTAVAAFPKSARSAPLKQAASSSAAATAAAAPSLSIEALGHLNRFHSIARQMPGDWTGMGIEAVTQHGDDAFHMQLPYMAYALAVVQHSKTPAYRELYKITMDRIIEKMRRNEVWDYWEAISTGEAEYGHDHKNLIRKAEADPIKNANVMYSGHILPLLTMYEMFYKDDKWSSPGSFNLNRVTPSGNMETFSYDIDSVYKNVVRQFEESGYLGMECYIDTLFPTTCILFPIHGLIHYDAIRGSHFSGEIIAKHVAAWQKISTLYRMDKVDDAPFVYHPSRHTVGLSDPVALGKTQFMNVFVPDYIRAAFPVWRKRLFDISSDGMLVMRDGVGMKEVAARGEESQAQPASHDHHEPIPAWLTGSIEQLAHKVPPAAMEVGDETLAAAAYRFADHHNPPVWRDGELNYERNDEHGTPRFLNRRASILLASGRVWSKDAYRNLYAKPWGKAELGAPEVQGVDYPNVLVSQAYHDAKRGTVFVTILPHGILPRSQREKTIDTTFRVVRLDPARKYRVLRDGVAADEVVSRSGDVMTIRTRLDGRPQAFEIVAA